MKRLLVALVAAGCGVPSGEYLRKQDEAAAYRRAYESAEERAKGLGDALSDLQLRVRTLEDRLARDGQTER